MKERILRMLRTAGESPVSGQRISEELSVTRAAVWKTVRALEEEGYVFEAATRRGYRLLSSPDTLTDWEIGSRLQTVWAGRTREAREYSPVSTNLRLKQLAEEGAPEGTLVTADVQENGRGRRGRIWYTPPAGCHIAMSLLLRPENIRPEQLSSVTLASAMAVRDGTKAVTGREPVIKWPNDLLIDGRKMTGILTELALEEDRISYLIVGIGINVNQESFPQEPADHAVSLFQATGRKWSRAQILADTLLAFEKVYAVFRQEGFSGLREDYARSLAGLGQSVRVLDREPWTGVLTGVDDDGEALVRDGAGKVRKVRSGEVSLR